MSSCAARALAVLALALAACVSTPPSGPVTPETFDAERAGLVVPVPDGWKTRVQETALVYEGKMRVPSFVFYTTKYATLEEGVAALEAEVGAALEEVKVSEAAAETTLAGYRAFVAEGTGKAEGYTMRWRATLVDADELTMMLALVPSFLWGFNKGRVHEFEASVRRAGEPAPGDPAGGPADEQAGEEG